MSNTKTIAKNTGWYGLELAISFIATLVSSILMARSLGPSRMGYIIYVSWIASIVGSLGGIGIPATTRKYMAEFLGKGDRGTARYIYFRTMQLQIGMASLATAGILFWVLRDAPVEFRIAALLIVLSIWPSMVNSVSAQANAATEQLSTNVPASVISVFTYLIGIAATVVFGWGVVGVGAATLSMRAVDFIIRLLPTINRIRVWETTHVQPAGLRKRMMTFAWQSITSMVVALIVWNRSEVILLRHLCADIRQIAFYSLAFSIGDALLLGSNIFGTAAGATIFAQYGRDRSRLPDIVATAFRYLVLISVPLHVISAALALPALLLLYGSQYKDAAMVVTLAPLLCMPKAFIAPVQNLLESAERQRYVIAATFLAGIVDLSVAWYFIRAHGAVGACVGSGAAQVTAVGMMWSLGIWQYKVKLPWLQTVKVAFSSVLASLAAHYIAVQLAPLWGILFGGSAALIVLFALFYLIGVLEPEDQERFTILTRMMPKPFARPANHFISALIRSKLVVVTPSNL